MRLPLALVAVALAALAGCAPCSLDRDCAPSEVCIADRSCARLCSPDGGSDCPAGTICQAATDACSGRTCRGRVFVCQ